MLLRVLQFIVGVLLAGGGGYLGWTQRATAANLFPPGPNGLPFLLIVGILGVTAGIVFLVSAVHPRPNQKRAAAEKAAREDTALQTAETYYNERSRAADRDWRAAPITPPPAPVPTAVPPPPPQAAPAPVKPAPVAPPQAAPAPVKPAPVAPPPAAPAAPAAAPAPPKPAPVAPPPAAPAPAAPIAAPIPPPAPVAPPPRPVAPPAAPVAPPPPAPARPVAAPVPPPPAPTPTAPPPPPVNPFPSPVTLTPIPRAPATPPPAPAAVAPPPAPAPVAPPPAPRAPVQDGPHPAIRAAIAAGKLAEAEKMLNAARESATGLDLAHLTALAGDHAAAAGQQSHARWLWRLATKRFGENGAAGTPDAQRIAALLAPAK